MDRAISIEAIPALRDNYIWALSRGEQAVVVDPGDAAPVQSWLRAQGKHLAAILITHHHADHVAGLAELVCADLPVYGPAFEPIGGITRPLAEADHVELPALGLSLTVLEVPGHTRGHIAYFTQAHSPPLLFCGDTLFACGCGRIFEGTPAQLWHSLCRLAALPGDTEVYCTHEYTLSNIHFARAVEPENAALNARAKQAGELRARALPTLPSCISLERETNPFLRAHLPHVRKQAEARAGRALADEIDVFAQLREWKNNF
jgi:hydroxyacylglutathione hydrolase